VYKAYCLLLLGFIVIITCTALPLSLALILLALGVEPTYYMCIGSCHGYSAIHVYKAYCHVIDHVVLRINW
jgi:hypothetical protein